MTVYLFDMDGTLTAPRVPMEREFAKVFIEWLKTHKAYIATGSDFLKVQEQLPEDIINSFTGIFCSMGNQFRKGRTIIYQNEFLLSDELRKDLENYRKISKYPGPFYSNYIEERVGMVNFSILGRNCPFEDRQRYSLWDFKNKERQSIQLFLQKKYPNLEISVGGAISIDITPTGHGKGQIASAVRKKYPSDEIVFFGDKTFEGGNDYELAQSLRAIPNTKIIQVDGPENVLIELNIV